MEKIPEKVLISRYGEYGRLIGFQVINSENPVEQQLIDFTGLTKATFTLHKPDGNLYIEDLDIVTYSEDNIAVIALSEQMTAAEGKAHYDITLTFEDETDGFRIITAHGNMVIDTPIAGTAEINSVSSIYGYIFPDDFQLKLTAGSNITISDDNVISATGGGGGGTGDYNDLTNKPKINNVILSGNKTTSQLGLPTKTSDLLNDSGFITAAVANLTFYYKKSETYTQAEVNALISAISKLTLEVVAELPDHDISTTTIYLVPKDVPGTEDIYDEYIYVSNSWEKIGSTAADLSNYYTKSQADTLLTEKVDKEAGKGLSTNDFTNAEKNKLAGIAAGAEVNVQADWNQANPDADDFIKNKPSIGVYTAGNGIDITNGRISVTTQVLDQITETAANLGHPPAYDSTASYGVGDVCFHDGYSYKCNTPITGGEAWDSNHWDATDAYNEIDALNQNLAELESALGTVVTDGNASVTLPASTYTNIASVQLGKGVWIIISLLQIGASIQGVYIHQLLAGSSELSLVRNNGQNGGGSSNATIVTLSATTTITLRAYIGTATTAKGSITAVRIK